MAQSRRRQASVPVNRAVSRPAPLTASNVVSERLPASHALCICLEIRSSVSCCEVAENESAQDISLEFKRHELSGECTQRKGLGKTEVK